MARASAIVVSAWLVFQAQAVESNVQSDATKRQQEGQAFWPFTRAASPEKPAANTTPRVEMLLAGCAESNAEVLRLREENAQLRQMLAKLFAYAKRVGGLSGLPVPSPSGVDTLTSEDVVKIEEAMTLASNVSESADTPAQTETKAEDEAAPAPADSNETGPLLRDLIRKYLEHMTGVEDEGVGDNAALTEAGYGLVFAEHSDEQMKRFIVRVMTIGGKDVAEGHQGDLANFTAEYSGTKGEKKSLDSMMKDIKNLPWMVKLTGKPKLKAKTFDTARTKKNATGAKVPAAPAVPVSLAPQLNGHAGELPVGEDAPLTEEGYQRVFSAHSDLQMLRFIERVMINDGQQLEAGHEDYLAGLTQWYSGTKGKHQSLNSLRSELGDKEWIVKSTNLSEDGFQKVYKGGDYGEMQRFIVRVLHASGLKVLDNDFYSLGNLTQLCLRRGNGTATLKALRVTLKTAPWAVADLTATDEIPLSEEGYRKVSWLMSSDVMANFIVRILYKTVGAEAVTREKVQELKPIFGKYAGSGDEHSFADMQAEVFKVFGRQPASFADLLA